MENRAIFLLSFALSNSIYAKHVEFPKGCPADNLGKICSTLGKIGNDKVLVFADGTQLPACYTQTADESSRKDHYDAEDQLRKILLKAVAIHFFGRTRPLSEGELKKVNDTVSNSMTIVESISDLKNFPWFTGSSEAIAAIDRFISFKEKIRPPKAYFGKNFVEDAKFATNELRKLAEDLAPAGNVVRENIVTGLNTSRPLPHTNSSRIHCRPKIAAFHGILNAKDQSAFAMTPALSHYPPSTRIQIIGHEIAHKFDPCTLPAQKDSPLASFIDCLQNQAGDFKQSAPIGKCDTHTKEAFCDAIGVHVQEAWIKSNARNPIQIPEPNPNMIMMPPGYENIFTLLDFACSSSNENDSHSTHPNSMRRLENIVLKSPVIANSLGCPSVPDLYRCDIKRGAIGTPPGLLQKTLKLIQKAVR